MDTEFLCHLVTQIDDFNTRLMRLRRKCTDLIGAENWYLGDPCPPEVAARAKDVYASREQSRDGIAECKRLLGVAGDPNPQMTVDFIGVAAATEWAESEIAHAHRGGLYD